MHELAYKLEVEKKVKLASQKMEQLGVSAKEENEESNEKILLLKRALQKYQGLYIPGEGKLVKGYEIPHGYLPQLLVIRRSQRKLSHADHKTTIL